MSRDDGRPTWGEWLLDTVPVPRLTIVFSIAALVSHWSWLPLWVQGLAALVEVGLAVWVLWRLARAVAFMARRVWRRR